MNTLALDVGATNLRIATITDGSLGPVDRRRTPAGAGTQMNAIQQAIADHLTPDVEALGVAIAGVVAWPDGHLTGGGILELSNCPLKDVLIELTGRPVAVDNDANAALLAEYSAFSPAPPSMLLVTIGTGIGGALIANGSLHRGRHGAAAEVGHITIGPAQHRWEHYASGRALGRLALNAARGKPALPLAQEINRRHHPTAAVIRLANAGDAQCRTLIEEWGHKLELGLTLLDTVLAPHHIILGGGLAGAAHDALAVHGALARLPPTSPANFGDNAGLVGAALLARNERGTQATDT